MIERERSKGRFLRNIASMQSRAEQLMLSSEALRKRGRLRDAERAYAELSDALGELLHTIERHDRRYSDSPFGSAGAAGQRVDALLTLADVKESLRETAQEAEALRSMAMQIARAHLPEADVAERLRQRAASLRAQSRYHEAIVALVLARDELARRGDALMVGHVVADIAQILEWLGDDERAGREAEAARRPIESLRRRRSAPSTLLAIWLELAQLEARTKRRLQRYDESEKLYRRVLEYAPPEARPAIGARLAISEIERGNTEDGRRKLAALLPSFVGPLRPEVGALLSWQSEALLRLDRPVDALPLARDATAELATHRDTESLWRAQWREARALSALDRDREALDAFVRGAETVGMLRHASLGYRLDSTHFAETRPFFADAIRLASRLQDAPTCVRLIEAVKARDLAAVLSTPGRAGEDADEPSLRIDEISRELGTLAYEAHRTGRTSDREGQRRRLLHERKQLIELRRRADPRWRALTEPPRFDLSALQRTLARREQAALSLFDTGAEIVAVVCTERTTAVDAIPVAPKTRAALASYAGNLQATSPSSRLFDPAAVDGLDAASLVPAELLEMALAEKSLVIAPHGALHLIPWAALRFGAGRLFERCPIGVLPNLSCVSALDSPMSAAPRVVLLGAPLAHAISGYPPLPLAEPELDNLAAIHANAGGVVERPFAREEATRSRFFELARDGRSAGAVLHMVCHAVFETGEPLDCGLLLTDGRLDAAEIVHSRLRYDEVVLSACSTGRRPTAAGDVELTGDDVLGLPGAFLEAGVESVLVSIPPARDDAALRFMLRYHGQRARGDTPLQALHETQMAMLTDSVYEPHLWIGFTVYGSR